MFLWFYPRNESGASRLAARRNTYWCTKPVGGIMEVNRGLFRNNEIIGIHNRNKVIVTPVMIKTFVSSYALYGYIQVMHLRLQIMGRYSLKLLNAIYKREAKF